MTEDDIEQAAREALAEIAPEADLNRLDPAASFHEQFEIDSMDFVNFVAALAGRVQLAIPEEDYYRLATLNGCIRYLKSRSAPSP
jgi:acyl carrier protein